MLRFFGRKPVELEKVVPGAPYHDLTLADPIKDPSWIRRWDDYLTEHASPARRAII